MQPDVNLYGYKNYRVMNEAILYEEGMSALKQRYTIEEMPDGESYRHRGNFIGLLLAMNIPTHKYVLIMVLNNITNPYDFDGTPFPLKVPIDSDSPF